MTSFIQLDYPSNMLVLSGWKPPQGQYGNCAQGFKAPRVWRPCFWQLPFRRWSWLPTR